MSGNNKPPRIEQWEINKYWEIFSGLNPQNGVLTGDKAAAVLKNSQLTDSQLEKIWDLSDVDGDGNLDFEEFCVAMRLIFDLINGVYKDVPQTLPDWLVPADKAHLVAANAAIQNKGPAMPRYSSNQDDDEDEELGLSSDFDWYMSREDKAKYEAIYSADCDRHGDISFDALSGLYASLDIPEVDIRSAWNLINPKQDEKIGRDQAIVFLHILNNRHRGVRVPRSVPASLRATFEHRQIDYNLGNNYSGSEARFTRQAIGGDDRFSSQNKKSSSKSDFGSSYLDRLGLSATGTGSGSGGRSWAEQEGTDFSSTKDTDWEKVRLKRQLADLQEQVTKAEAASQRRKDELRNRVQSGSSAVVRRELESMYDYKRGLLRKAKNGEFGQKDKSGQAALADARDEIDLVKQQVKALEDHYERRNRELQLVLDEIQTAKSARA